MQNPYSEIFRAAGAKGFAAAGFLARLPIAMAPIGIVAMLSQTHGEYWLAGAVSATYALANAFLAPQISRLVDRLGQTRIVVPTTCHCRAGLRDPDCGGQSALAAMDAVRVGAAGRRHAQHSGLGARPLDRDFSRSPLR